MSKATKMAACQMIDEIRIIFGGEVTHQFSHSELMEKFGVAAERVVERYHHAVAQEQPAADNYSLHDQAQQLADTRSAYSLARELLELQAVTYAALSASESFISEVSEKTGFGQAHTLRVVRSAMSRVPALGLKDQCDATMKLLRGAQ